MLRMAERLRQDWEINYEDLGNVFAREHIQSCNACVSTSMALCVWPCNCYEKNSRWEPDLMWNLDLYSRLDLADAWVIIGPINWYAPTSNLKLMFDRLVCMNGGNPREELIEHKDAELAKKLQHAPEWEELSLNHLEGRTAGFFCYGGGDELDEQGLACFGWLRERGFSGGISECRHRTARRFFGFRLNRFDDGLLYRAYFGVSSESGGHAWIMGW